MASPGGLSPLFWTGALFVGVLLTIWSKTSRATDAQKRLVTTCFLVVLTTMPALVTRVVDPWVIVVADGLLIASGMLSLTWLRPYVAAFAISFAIALFVFTLVVPSITDPNGWCPSRHVVAGVCQSS
jgi:hypothetical protein